MDKKTPRIVEPVNITEDIIVATRVADELDKSGTEDVSDALQKLLDECADEGGGAVFMPAGKYRVTRGLIIPGHVTLRGDWKDPDGMAPGAGDYGTVIIADVPSETKPFPGLFRMTGSSGLKGLTIWYPSQCIDDVKPYPWTIELPGTALPGNAWMAQSVVNVTLLNSYRGLAASLTKNDSRGAHEIHYINNLKGTPLSTGIHMQNCSDTGRTLNVTLADKYWANAGAAYNAPDAGKLLDYTLANATGVAFGDTEWENAYNIHISDANTGFRVMKGPRIGALMLVFGLHADNCVTALKIEAVDDRCGVEFANCSFKTAERASAVALHITEDYYGSSLFNNCEFESKNGTLVCVEGNHYADFQNCRFGRFGSEYAVDIIRGRLIMEGCGFTQPLTSANKGVNLQKGCRAAVIKAVKFAGDEENLLTDNGAATDKDLSGWENFPHTPVVDHAKFTGNLKPAGSRLIIATDAPFFVPGDGKTGAAAPLQKALNEMEASGGGIVFLPRGCYRIDEPVTVPAGVELRGIDDVHHRGESRGTNFFIVHGHATAAPDSDPASITLKRRAGLRGVSFYYPNYTNNPDEYMPYPWAVRGDGVDIYILDVTFINAYKGIDLSGEYSAPCDRHYVRYAAGCVLKDGIRVGNCKNGWLENCNFNPNYWTRTDFPIRANEGNYWNDVGKFIANNLTMLALGSCENENVLNYAFYGAQTAYRFYSQNGKGPDATLINVPADGTSGNVIVEATGERGVTMTNTVLCVLAATKETNDGIDVRGGRFGSYNALALGMKDYNIRIQGGESVFSGGVFFEKPITATGGKSFLSGMIIKTGMRGGRIKNPSEVILYSDINALISKSSGIDAVEPAKNPLVWSEPSNYDWAGPGGGRFEPAPPEGGGPGVSVGIDAGGLYQFYQEKNASGEAADIRPYMKNGALRFEIYADSAEMLKAHLIFVELNTSGNDRNYIRLSFKEQFTADKTWIQISVSLSGDVLAYGGEFNPGKLRGVRIWLHNYRAAFGDGLWESAHTDRLYFRNVNFEN